MILELYWGRDVEIKEKQREMGNKHLPPTWWGCYLSKKKASGVYAPLVLMPHYLR
jgi:hypothetical protein